MAFGRRDHVLRQKVLDLLRRELAPELRKELARLFAADGVDLDGREQIAIALGDGEVKAQMARHEALQLFADRADQRSVATEMFGLARRAAHAPTAEARLDACVVAFPRHDITRRQVRTRKHGSCRTTSTS